MEISRERKLIIGSAVGLVLVILVSYTWENQKRRFHLLMK